VIIKVNKELQKADPTEVRFLFHLSRAGKYIQRFYGKFNSLFLRRALLEIKNLVRFNML